MFEKLFPYFQNPQIEALENTIRTFVVHQAVIAPFLLLFLEESGIPLPIPGDVYLAFTGYQVSKGTVPYWGGFIMLLIAVLGGSSILYFISAKWGTILVDNLGIYLHINKKNWRKLKKILKNTECSLLYSEDIYPDLGFQSLRSPEFQECPTPPLL